ncbi:hypothetical protein [Oscillatoria acuminata]|uniref:Uncharacterized protein n=2 Tax=Oscillatoriophycideae TaxID=1301283 RepID=K9TMK3_9CYAN|nr:hypothetical protein [Oscillatoria acuminata]AFY83249.1 hypothetical protein Oscil6304_3688 [Oscillatoria acuminata PCC 6304]
MMQVTATVRDMFINASLSQQISFHDWVLLNALPESNLSQEERRMIKRLMHSVRRGWFRVLS